ncbi:hypothetical protein GCM10009677_29790 [Sphaerisporangium rubeum]
MARTVKNRGVREQTLVPPSAGSASGARPSAEGEHHASHNGPVALSEQKVTVAYIDRPVNQG